MKKNCYFAIAIMACFVSCESTVSNLNSHEYVDLGLSVKWATCNVGANSPEEYGDYFAWGETKPKEYYDWSTYKWYNYNEEYNEELAYDGYFTKYCVDNYFGPSITPADNKTVLDAVDDAATTNWGGKWRMPTEAEQIELMERCTWTWTVLNEVKGYKVVGPNGNYIFLPAAGMQDDDEAYGMGEFGSYFSNTLCSEDSNNYVAHAIFMEEIEVFYDDDYGLRSFGRSIRPVCK